MSEVKNYCIFGATGLQGGGIVDGLVEAGQNVVAVTRNVESEKAKALAEKSGVTVVQADMDDASSLEAAVKDADGVFLVTNFWEHFDAAKEVSQAVAVGNACAAAGVKHVVFSWLEDTRKMMKGKVPAIKSSKPSSKPTLMHCHIEEDDLTVPHFDGKGMALEKLKTILGEDVLTGAAAPCYFENFTGMMKPTQTGDSRLICNNMGAVPAVFGSVYDYGRAVAQMLIDGPSKWAGQYIGLGLEHITFEEMCKTLTEVTGLEYDYVSVPDSFAAKMNFPGADDLANMWAFKRECTEVYRACRGPDLIKGLYPKVRSWKQFVEENKDVFTS